jgi:hypothetical protein
MYLTTSDYALGHAQRDNGRKIGIREGICHNE